MSVVELNDNLNVDNYAEKLNLIERKQLCRSHAETENIMNEIVN